MNLASASVLLHAPRRHHGAKPSVGTLSVNLTCDAPAYLHLLASIYEVPAGRQAHLATFTSTADGIARAHRSLALVLHLSHSALSGLAHRASTSALLELRASGTGGSMTRTLTVGRLRSSG